MARARGILAIETSQAQGSVAWSPAPGEPAHDEPFPIGLVHGREILPRIDALAARVPFSREEIDAVAVSAGPGSFTGARIGVAAAKAIAYALDRPVLAISSLEVLAHGVLDRVGELGDGTAPFEVAVVLDARRQLLYGARFRIEADRLERITEDAAENAEEFFAGLPAETVLTGEGVETLPGVDRFRKLDASFATPQASLVATIARTTIDSFDAGTSPPPEWEDPHQLIPKYLRRTAAEEAREARHE